MDRGYLYDLAKPMSTVPTGYALSSIILGWDGDDLVHGVQTVVMRFKRA